MEFWLFLIFCVLLLIAVLLLVMTRNLLGEARSANTILIAQLAQANDALAANGKTLDDISTKLDMVEGRIMSIEILADRMVLLPAED